MKNILITCLSTYSKKEKDYLKPSLYTLKIPANDKYNAFLKEHQLTKVPGNKIQLEGYTTNEPAAKSLITELAMNQLPESGKSNNGITLDEIILICTESVRNERYNPQIEESEFNEYASGKTVLEYYRFAIDSFIQEKFPSLYKNKKILYNPFDIDDEPKDGAIIKLAVDVAGYINSYNEKVRIHLDFNGGMRFIMTSILSFINLLDISQRSSGVLGRIYSTNYQSKEKENPPEVKTHQIEHHKDLFDTIKLSNAISECISYGRISGLATFFKAAELTNKNKMILKQIEEFLERLQLCSTDYILEKKVELNDLLEKYINIDSSTIPETTKPAEQLFYFAIKDIHHVYSELLTNELPDMILWCVEHGFIQQAITFGSEDIPWYIVDKKIIEMTELDKKEFEKDVEDDIKNNNTRRYHIKDLEKLKSNVYKYSRCWFTFMQNNQNAVKNHIKNDKLKRLWDDYNLIKWVRNKINHADSNMDYQTVKSYIINYAEELKEFDTKAH